MTHEGLSELYEVRFSRRERAAKDEVWKALCAGFFQRFIRDDATVLDIACGYGEFIRHIRAGRKLAIDANPAVEGGLPSDIEFFRTRADEMTGIASSSVDVCFTSNFFEHLESHAAMDAVLQEGRRVLVPGGRFICMQPNIRYAFDRYWDFYDHVLPLSHMSGAEGFAKNGYEIEQVIPRFVPFSTKSSYPKHPWFVRTYLKLPLLWRLLGQQFVIVARSPGAAKGG